MKLTNKIVTLAAPNGNISMQRNSHGIPEITGKTFPDLAYGLGWVHAYDRQLQILLTRALIQGRASEKLAATPELIAVDRYMRRMNFYRDAEDEAAKLWPEVREQVTAYVDGFNKYLSENKTLFEFRMLGYRPEPLEIRDVMVMAKIMGFIGLADAQGNMEKFIVQMVQKGIEEPKLKELFPYLTEKIDYRLLGEVTLADPPVPEAVAWLAKLPRFNASNNWVASGSRTGSGRPILCNDPHLEINRIPGIWYEAVMRLPDNNLIGATLPGVPGLVLGRSSHISWGTTFAFMDMIDYRVEECRDGSYRRGTRWVPFRVREETISVKKGRPVKEKIYENEHGTLEGDPHVPGHYLVMCWSADKKCGSGDFNGLISLSGAENVREAMQLLKLVDAGSWSFVISDTEGNIGYQMTGRAYNRPRGVSGLVPLPGWEKKFDPKGFIDKNKLPAAYNPKAGFIATANQDLNHLGKTPVINLAMAPYRAERISALLTKKKNLTVDDMKSMHYDLYSLQAERLMKAIRPLLPDTDNGAILRDWDLCYREDSPGATLFESVYRALIRVVFGDNGIGREVVDRILGETSLFADYYGNFDQILLKKKSSWFAADQREGLFRKAIGEGLEARAVPYGKTRKVVFAHLLLGGKLPRFFGFDRGPITLPGGRATIPQGQIFKSAGRTTTYNPSYRMIADMDTDEIHTNLPGGPSDRRFSRWYVSDLGNWMSGVYKIMK